MSAIKAIGCHYPSEQDCEAHARKSGDVLLVQHDANGQSLARQSKINQFA